MVRSKSNVNYYAEQIKHIIMRKDVVYLGMIWCNDIVSLNTSDEGIILAKSMHNMWS
jgi:hypothetical protein